MIFEFFLGYEWVGWRNDTPNMLGRPVEITFEFDYSRNFTAMHLHTNNFFTKEVQVCSKLYWAKLLSIRLTIKSVGIAVNWSKKFKYG